MDNFQQNTNGRLGTRPSGYTQPPYAPYGQPYVPQQNQGQAYAQNGQPSPTSIYESRQNAAPYGGMPQYHYGAPMAPMVNMQYIAQQQERLARRNALEKDLKKCGTRTGLTLLAFLVVASLFSVVFVIPKLEELYATNFTVENALGVLYSLLTIGVVFFVANIFYKKLGTASVIPLGKPHGKLKVPVLIFMSLGGCVAANYLATFVAMFFETFGLYVDYGSVNEPQSTLDIIIMFAGTAVVAPLVEEFAMRGVIMQGLRKYGNAFAIITTSFIFAIFHGNAIQMVFAFMCGLLLGYAAIATNSLWTSILIHAAVNSLSCITTAVNYYAGEQTANITYTLMTVVLIAGAVILLFVYLFALKPNKILDFKVGELSTGAKFRSFLKSPAMIIAIILFVIEALASFTTTPTY